MEGSAGQVSHPSAKPRSDGGRAAADSRVGVPAALLSSILYLLLSLPPFVASWFNVRPTGRACLDDARLDVGRRVAFAQGQLDLVLDGAGDLVAPVDAPARGHRDVEIDPVVPAAVAVAELVVA